MTRKAGSRILNPTLVWLLASSLFAAGCAHHPSSTNSFATPEDARSFSPEEVEIGQQIHQQMLSSFYTYTDPRVVDYVNHLGTSLAGSRGALDYHFTVLYNDRIYATSSPGGYVYVTTGLMNQLDNEAEFAAILAQEIGLLQFVDPRVSSGQKAVEMFSNGVAVAAPFFGQFGALAMLGVMALNMAAEAGKPGEDERLMKSDELALRYMTFAGYDPQGFLDLFRKFLSLSPQELLFFYDYYQTHPITEERYGRLTEAFERLPLSGQALRMKRKEYLEATKGIREMYKPENPSAAPAV